MTPAAVTAPFLQLGGQRVPAETKQYPGYPGYFHHVRLDDLLPSTGYAYAVGHAGALVVAPPSAQATPWLKRFGDYSDAFASGWMAIRGARRQRAVDQGFVLSDHADWPSLQRAIAATGAKRIFVTHGFTETLVRWLSEQGYDAHVMETQFEGEAGAEEAGA